MKAIGLRRGDALGWMLLFLGNAVAGLLGMCHPALQAAWLPLTDGRGLWVWSQPWGSAGAAATLLGILVLTRVLLRRRARRTGPDLPPLAQLLAPLAWTPVLPLVLLARPLVPQAIAASIALWGLAGILAAIAARGYAHLAVALPSPRRPALAVFVGFTLVYTIAGAYFTHIAGPHSGDENHYITIARSIRQDGDLDLRNNVRYTGERWRAQYHISPASRGDHWYSEHPIGLSLLLWPVVDAGLVWRHLLLAALSGAASAGIVRLALNLGAPAAAALLFSGLVSLSMFWGIYSCRALPEVMGAALTVWMVIGILDQGRRPWRSMGPVLLAIATLPWAHIRFMPVGLLGWGFYGLRGLWRPASWPATLGRLGIFTFLSALGLGLYYYPQYLMFTGASSYADKGLLMSFPLGIWETLAGNRGILVALPAFAWLWWAAVRAFLRTRGEQRYGHGVTLVMTIAVLATSCATIWFSAGACLPGRFLVVITPLVAASAATVWPQANRAARGLLLVLSGYAAALFLLWIWNLNLVGTGFVHPLRTLGWQVPALGQMLDPLREPHDPGGHRFGLLLHLVILALLARDAWSPRLQRLALALLAAGAVASHITHPHPPLAHNATRGALRIDRFAGPNARVAGRAPTEPAALFAHLDRFAAVRWEENPLTVTTADLGAARVGTHLSLPHLDANDWLGRTWAWATLIPPFRAPTGPQTFRILGSLEGPATLRLALRNGGTTLMEEIVTPDAAGRIHLTRTVNTHRRRGDIYLLSHLMDGQGAFILDRVHWAPTPDGLLSALNLTVDD